MGRISVRLDDDLHDRLIRRAMRSNISLSELLRPALWQVADPGQSYVPTSQDAQIVLSARLLTLVLLDLENRAPELVSRGERKALRLLQKWGLPDEVCNLIPGALETTKSD